MLRDITIGQHFPGNSIVHRLDPRVKIVLSMAYIVMLFVGSNPIGIGISVVFLAWLYAMAKIPGKVVARSMKPLIPILLLTTILNLFFTSTGIVLVSFWVIKITTGGIYFSLMMAIRIACLIIGTGLLTYTTSPIVMTDAIERLLSPLAKFRFPAHELAMMMTITLRMIPTLIEETDKIMNAQKARGAQLDAGNLFKRITALVPILIPLFLSAFRRAEELALAMEARCYRGGEGRTRLRRLRIVARDIACAVFCVLIFVGIGISGTVWGQIGPVWMQ